MNRTELQIASDNAKTGQQEIALRDWYLSYISSPKYIKETSNDVWGAEVRRFKQRGVDDEGLSEYEEFTDKLENWYITLPIAPDTNIDLYAKEFRHNVDLFMLEQMNKLGITVDNAHEYTCYQLCDWYWLEDEKGNIIRNGQATLVKYAKILKDLEVKE